MVTNKGLHCLSSSIQKNTLYSCSDHFQLPLFPLPCLPLNSEQRYTMDKRGERRRPNDVRRPCTYLAAKRRLLARSPSGVCWENRLAKPCGLQSPCGYVKVHARARSTRLKIEQEMPTTTAVFAVAFVSVIWLDYLRQLRTLLGRHDLSRSC